MPEGLWEIVEPLLPSARVRPQGGGTANPDLAEALFGDIVRSAREKLELPDDTIAQTLRDAVRWGIPDDDEEEALEEFLRRTLPPSVSQ